MPDALPPVTTKLPKASWASSTLRPSASGSAICQHDLRSSASFEDFLAEPNKGGIGVARWFRHPLPPFLFQDIHIPSRRDRPRVMVGFRVGPDVWEGRENSSGLVATPVGKNHHVAFHPNGIIWHMSMLPILTHDVHDQAAKFLFGGAGTAFGLHLCESDLPFFLRPAVLAGEFVNTSFQGFAQTKIVPVQGQHFTMPDGVEHPIRKPDFYFLHPPVACLTNNFEPVDQSEAIELFFTARDKVGRDHSSLKPF